MSNHHQMAYRIMVPPGPPPEMMRTQQIAMAHLRPSLEGKPSE